MTPTQLATLEVIVDHDGWISLAALSPEPSILRALRGTEHSPTPATARSLEGKGLVEVRFKPGYHGLRDFLQLRVTPAGRRAYREATA